MAVDAFTEAEVVGLVHSELEAGRGGTLATLNIDIFRAITRNPGLRDLIGDFSLVVPDGMPVVWAARLRGTPVGERVTGSSLIFSLTEAAATHGRSVYLLGGAPGVPERAADALRAAHPELVVAGADAPPLGFDASESNMTAVHRRLVAAAPDIVYVGLGFPKQERLIARIAPFLPSTWFVACGAAITFAAGVIHRAPRWMQRAGLEWVHRLGNEPRRLGRRYVVDDLPFAVALLASSAAHRFGGRRHEEAGRRQPPLVRTARAYGAAAGRRGSPEPSLWSPTLVEGNSPAGEGGLLRLECSERLGAEA